MTKKADPAPAALASAIAIERADHNDPFSFLGPHDVGAGKVVRVYAPAVAGVDLIDRVTGESLGAFARLDGAPDLFTIEAPASLGAYRLRFHGAGEARIVDDPYRFGPMIGDLDEHLFSEGAHWRLWTMLGAHPIEVDGVDGVRFTVWAPNASRVSVVGEFNDWDGRRHPMRQRGATGVWEIFLPGVAAGARYKYEILTRDHGVAPLKADPVAFGAEHPPSTASIVRKLAARDWRDSDWMARRGERIRTDRPVSIYEAQLGSWKRKPEEGGRSLSYHELADDLVPYVRDMGFTHLELLPVSEHPFDGSWGYQPVGLYAPTIRHGTLEEFRDFVEACHAADIGLILDWVPAHFPSDAHGLAQFDGTPLYEHADPREGFHPDWNTLVYNFGRREVANFLIANALYWAKEHHVDGLRVDAVASMLYRDYSRKDGEWVPNVHGGRENLEAIAFLQRMNQVVYGEAEGVCTIAEESTAFPAVSRPVHHGGLGFGYKWNMGWMNDTLSYISREPIHRRYHHHQMTFGLHYAFSENFILPISHDEVVHGKGSMLAKMPGDRFDKFANLRAYYGFMWAHPGKKLLFMGNEIAQGREWNHSSSIDWHLLGEGLHAGVQTFIRDLNAFYRRAPAMHQRDCRGDGFEWVEANAAAESWLAWLRYGDEGAAPVLCVSNFTPVERRMRVGVPAAGRWAERINSDAAVYGGAGRGNLGGVASADVAANGRPHSIEITLPPLSTLMFEHER